MDVTVADSRPTRRGKAEYFTGVAWFDDIADCPPPSRLNSVRVTFEPGARTHWHTHPLGQILYVLSGVGRVQRAGAPVQVIRPGDTVHISPGEKHWHGAAPDRVFVHLAMQEKQDGSATTWLEPVSDADYLAG